MFFFHLVMHFSLRADYHVSLLVCRLCNRSGLPTVTPDLCAPTQPPQQGRGLLPCPPNCPSAAPQSASQPLLPTPSHTHTISAHNHMMPQVSCFLSSGCAVKHNITLLDMLLCFLLLNSLGIL